MCRARLPLPFALCVCAALAAAAATQDTPTTARPAATIPGTGTIAGTVRSPRVLKAAQVQLFNKEKRVLYAVWTRDGRFTAPNLFPGTYEVTVNARGVTATPVTATVKAAERTTIEVPVSNAAAGPVAQGGYMAPSTGQQVQFLSYDELYPPSPARPLLEKHCMVCHGRNFFPARQYDRSRWNTWIGVMMNPAAKQGAQIPPGTLSDADRKAIVEYAAAHFGPGSRTRALKIDAEFPVDEDGLSRAMYVEYLLPLDKSPKRRAQDPHFDKDGNVWYTDRGIPNMVGRLDPRTATFKDYLLPDPKGDPHGLTVDRFNQVFWSETVGLHLGRLDAGTGEMVRYAMDPKNEIPGGQGHTPVLDAEDNVWFTVIIGNRLGKWDRKTGTITLWPVPTTNSFPYGIQIGPDRRIWIAEFHGCKVAAFDPKAETFTEYPALTQPCAMRRMSVDSHGTVWYALFSSGKIGRIDPKTRATREYDVPMPFSEPYDIWPDEHDQMWISDAGQGGALIRFDPKAETFTYYPTPRVTDQPKLEITRDGAVWYCTRSSDTAAVGVLFPDVATMTYEAKY